MYESVSLDENKKKVLNKDVLYTEGLNRVYTDITANARKQYRE